MQISANDIIGTKPNTASSFEAMPATRSEIEVLRRKAQILEMLYEMSKTLGTVFDLKEIFARATDLIFAERLPIASSRFSLMKLWTEKFWITAFIRSPSKRETKNGSDDGEIDNQPDDHAKSDAR